MTRSSIKGLFTPFENSKREFRSSRKLFKTPGLDESSSPEFDLFSNLEENFEEEVAETMAETIEQYVSKTRADYGSGVTTVPVPPPFRPTFGQLPPTISTTPPIHLHLHDATDPPPPLMPSRSPHHRIHLHLIGHHYRRCHHHHAATNITTQPPTSPPSSPQPLSSVATTAYTTPSSPPPHHRNLHHHIHVTTTATPPPHHTTSMHQRVRLGLGLPS
ncbi:hypothetical protein Tco_0846821 [Tanacetum coccineum]